MGFRSTWSLKICIARKHQSGYADALSEAAFEQRKERAA
jgi:hypothetical protein